MRLRPPVTGKCFLQLLLCLFDVVRLREAKAVRDSEYVGVHGYPLVAESFSHHDVRRLSSDSRKLHQKIVVFRHLSPVLFDQSLSLLHDPRGLRLVETYGPYDIFDILRVCFGHSLRVRVFREELGRHFVDAHIGGLRRKSDRDQQAVYADVVEGALRFGIFFSESVEYPDRSFLFIFHCFSCHEHILTDSRPDIYFLCMMVFFSADLLANKDRLLYYFKG